MRLATITETFERIQFGDTIYLYRGVGKPNNLDTLGRWWSTNPYYSLRYAGGKEGQFFVASISQTMLNQALQREEVVDVSQDEYPNYIFKNSDPPGARPATEQEIVQLMINSGDLDQNGQEIPQTPGKTPSPGGRKVQQLWGQEAIDSGYKVFGNG